MFTYFRAPTVFSVLALLTGVACSTTSQRDADTDADVDTDNSPDAHTDSKPDADADPDADPDARPDADPDARPDAHMDAAPDADADAGRNLECKRTYDVVEFTVTLDSGVTVDCFDLPEVDAAALPQLQLSLKGTVQAVSATSFTLDTCDPATDCSPSLTTFQVEAAGLTLPLELGERVQADYSASVFFSCSEILEVHRLDDLDASSSGLTRADTLLLQAANNAGWFEESALQVTSQPLGCFNDPDGSCDVPDNHALFFDLNEITQEPVRVLMGQTKTLSNASAGPGGAAWSARNLRSYIEQGCDGTYKFSHYVVRTHD